MVTPVVGGRSRLGGVTAGGSGIGSEGKFTGTGGTIYGNGDEDNSNTMELGGGAALVLI
jgi:hypothetical protein